jgi:hypothetical protein
MTSDRHVASPCKLVAHHRGPLGDVPPTNRFVRVQAVVVSQLHPDHDALWRVRTFLDAYGAGVELGILPRRGSLGEKALRTLQGFGARAAR